MIRLPLVLMFSALLFSAGVYGVLARRNAVMVLMAIELMLNAVNVNLIAFSAQLNDVGGQVFALFVIAVAEGGMQTSTEMIGQALFSRYVLPFEAVSFLLLAALIGAIVLSRKDEGS